MTKTGTTATNGSRQAKSPKLSKKDQFLALLRRETGATIAEIVEATCWQPHSTRAMLTGLRKQGLAIDKTKVDGSTRYSLRGEQTA